MKGRFRLIGLFVVCALMIGTMVPAGGGERAALALEAQPGSVQGVVLASPPQPLPHDCNGATPPGEDPPACCAYGYVYYDGVPVTEASVHIESPYGVLDTTTTSGEASGESYYSADLSSAPLLVSPGDVITVTATYEGGSASTVYEVSPDGQQVDVVILINPLFGDGADGDLAVTDTYYTDGTRTALSGTASAGQKNVPVSSASGFAVDQEVLVIQMQETGAGNYEFGIIAGTGGGSLTLRDNLEHTYTVGGNSKVQVLRVPHYQNVTVQNGGKLTAHGWDGSTGGVLVFRANGTLQVQDGGTIDANYLGFEGGPGENNVGIGGRQGASYDGVPRNPGQGIGNSANYGGGGGGWECSGAGGGGGGYGTAGNNGQTICGTAGQGGNLYGNATLSLLYLGSGGGGASDGMGGLGGGNIGGGAILILARSITIDGTLSTNGADGLNGHWDADYDHPSFGGGGGSGGSIKLVSSVINVGSEKVSAIGGMGGRGVGGPNRNGGDGGVGRIRIEYCESLSGSTNPSASTHQWECHRIPIVTIHTVYPHPAVQGQDVVTFRGSAVDNDEDGASITQYVWRSDLDGVLSTQATFTRSASSLSLGAHTIYFKAQDDEGEWSEEVSTTLTVNEEASAAPVAQFTADVTSGTAPLTVHFTSQSTGNISSYSWDFGDGGTSTEQNPAHTYDSAGTYTVSLAATGPGGSDTETKTGYITVSSGTTAAWTFMLYLDGDNNLQPWLDRALDRLEENTNPNVNLLVLIDGAGSNDTWRYRVRPGGNYTDNVNRWYMGELDMGAPQTLTDFVTWAWENYTATYTYLAVANHGRGTSGIAWDDTSGSNHFITVAELRTALRDATVNATKPLDVVHYDACLMAMIEDAYQIKDYAGYLVASENLGWSVFAYDRYVSEVTDSTTPRDLAVAVAGEYYNHSMLAGYPRTISALDLSQAGTVKDAVSGLATALQGSMADNKYYIRNTRDATQKLDSRDYLRITLEDEYLDLYDFARLIKQNVPDDTVKNAAQGVMDAIGAVGSGFVVAEHHESGTYDDTYWDLDDAHGVSIYFPPASGGHGYSDYMGHVFRFTAEGQWDEFLLAYFGAMGLPPMDGDDPGAAPMLEAGYAVYLPVVIKN